jgi:hypothetical protein
MATSLPQHADKRGGIPLPKSPPTLLAVVLGALVVFYLIMRLLSDRSSVAGQLDVDLKEGKISINTHGEKAGLVEVIKQLFADDEKSTVTRTLLRELHGLYKYNDPSLVSALENLTPEHRVSRELRELVKHTKGPFGGIQKQVSIHLASDKSITGIIAASCTDSEFQGESLLIAGVSNSFITLNVSSTPFLCPPPPAEPIVRVSPETYRNLFGSVPPHPQTVTVSIYPFQLVADERHEGEPKP